MVSITILKYFMVRNLLSKKIMLYINVKSWKKHKYYKYLLILELKISIIFFQMKYSIFFSGTAQINYIAFSFIS